MRRLLRSRWLWLALIALALLLYFGRTRVPRDQVLIRTAGEEQTQPAKPWAQRFRDYAAMSALVYGHKGVPDPAGWRRQGALVSDEATSLEYQLWVRDSPAGAVIAFRGTQERKDWWSNARWVTRFIPAGWDQYTAVRERIAAIVRDARAAVPGALLVTTGHSLGGGLAQQAAYAHPDIDLVVAFDSSPVTGFRSVDEPERTRNRAGIQIFRVYEKGEILAYFRGFLRQILPLSARDPVITEVRFDLTSGVPAVKEHSMEELATRIAAMAGSP